MYRVGKTNGELYVTGPLMEASVFESTASDGAVEPRPLSDLLHYISDLFSIRESHARPKNPNSNRAANLNLWTVESVFDSPEFDSATGEAMVRMDGEEIYVSIEPVPVVKDFSVATLGFLVRSKKLSSEKIQSDLALALEKVAKMICDHLSEAIDINRRPSIPDYSDKKNNIGR